jgi:SIR2-like domain
MISIFLGAGFSVLGDVPLASQLFNEQSEVDVISRQRLVERVLRGWSKWHDRTEGTPEEYLAVLQASGGQQWQDATWYVALVIALRMGHVQIVGGKPTIVRHTVNLTSGIKAHEVFWTGIFRQTADVAVLTTNYDILAERGLRPQPRPRVPRPGFHYGSGPESLEGSGYPSFAHIHQIRAEGAIPLLKLHGSVSWALKDNRIARYQDCRPAIRGDALIVAPVTEKSVRKIFQPIWDRAASALAVSDTWVIVGYSFPAYDLAINQLFRANAGRRPRVHILNPDSGVTDRVRRLLPGVDVYSHPGLPDALIDLPKILER